MRAPLLMLPAASMLVLVFALPLGWFFVRALLIESPPDALPSLAHDVLTSRAMLIATWTTFWVSLIVTLVTLLAGYPVAYYMATRGRLRAAIVLFCVIVPYFTSVIVRTYAWMVLLGAHGVVNDALIGAGLLRAPLPLLYDQFGVTVGMAYVLLPYMVLTLYASMRAIDPALLRAARALGGGGFYVFRRIYLPLSMHGVLSGALIVFILSIGFFITPALMGGPSDVTVAMLVERAVEITLDWQEAAIMALLLLVATLVLYAVYCRVADLRRLTGEA
jgi:ABC-type spermidine/putrescine transport system permease subunit I